MNPWLARRVLHFAHQGGELEAPSNTLYAFRTAVAKGAHALEMDLHATRDGEIVVSHDPTVDRCTDGSGSIDTMTLDEVKSLDAAYRFVEGADQSRDAGDWPMRGVATGTREAPDGFGARDFTIPTFREVLEAFPGVFLNVDIKRSAPDTAPYEATVAALLDEFGRRDDVIVASFSDDTIRRFRAIAPGVTTAGGAGEAQAVWAHDAEPPGTAAFHALQAPWSFGGREVVTPERMARARDLGVAVHIWTVNDRNVMERLLDFGVDGIMTSRPSLLAGLIAERRCGFAR